MNVLAFLPDRQSHYMHVPTKPLLVAVYTYEFMYESAHESVHDWVDIWYKSAQFINWTHFNIPGNVIFVFYGLKCTKSYAEPYADAYTVCRLHIFLSYRYIRFAANCTRVDGPLYPGKIYTVLTIEIVLHLVNPSQSTPSTTDFTFFLTCPLFLLSTAVAAHHV
jgi:hypothetical protein